MRDQGIRGASRSKKRFTTKSDPTALRAPDLVNRNFTASRPDALWVADFTYCSTWSGIVYVAFVIDVFSRRLVGWKAARTMTTPLVLDALNMAAWTRRHTTLDGLVCHSDAGSQGEFNWPSQHLDDGGALCERRTGRRRSVSIGATFLRRDGQESPGARTESSSGRPLLAA
jgi:putative transposase